MFGNVYHFIQAATGECYKPNVLKMTQSRLLCEMLMKCIAYGLLNLSLVKFNTHLQFKPSCVRNVDLFIINKYIDSNTWFRHLIFLQQNITQSNEQSIFYQYQFRFALDFGPHHQMELAQHWMMSSLRVSSEQWAMSNEYIEIIRTIRISEISVLLFRRLFVKRASLVTWTVMRWKFFETQRSS